MRSWPPVRWLAAAAGAVVTGLLVGVPTDLIDTPLFTRMVPVEWWNYPVWVATAVLGGLVFATYVRTPQQGATATARGATSGGILSVLAVGCPVCNKLVVVALGSSGAMQYFAPVQPLLGVASLALLGVALYRRLQTERSCPVPAGRPT